MNCRRKTLFCPASWTLASEQSEQIASLSATIQDSVLWNHWDGAALPRHLSLSNYYTTQSDDTPVHPAHAPVVAIHADPKTAPADIAASVFRWLTTPLGSQINSPQLV